MSRRLGGSSRLARRGHRRTPPPLIPLPRQCNNATGAQRGLAGWLAGWLAGCTTAIHDRQTTKWPSTRRAPSGRHAHQTVKAPGRAHSLEARSDSRSRHAPHSLAGSVCWSRCQGRSRFAAIGCWYRGVGRPHERQHCKLETQLPNGEPLLRCGGARR